MRLAGGTNAVGGFTGYRPLSAEAVLLADPDLVVTTTQTLEGVGGVAGLMAAVPGLAGTRAGSAGRIAAFDALYLLGPAAWTGALLLAPVVLLSAIATSIMAVVIWVRLERLRRKVRAAPPTP